MIETKTKSVVISASAAIGTSGKAGYFHGITCMHGGGGAISLANVYNGTSTAGTEKWRIGTPNTATESKSVSRLNIYCPDGIYVAVSNAIVTIEYSSCV